MKRILITGADSFIGTSFEGYVNINFPDDFVVDTIDMKNDAWADISFSVYDVVFHVAGIAHVDNGKSTAEQNKLYYSVNTDLAIKTAEKAKADGVKQFVFMSSAIVYGNSASVGKNKNITKDSPFNPTSCYGDSKIKAEEGILPLNDENFRVVILRPPMIYGKGCKGNYSILSKIAKLTFVFPYVKNERSMLYIGNLCEFIRLMIVNSEQGVFFPQNNEYSNTSEIVRLIGTVHNKKVFLIKGFSWFIKLLSKFSLLANKAFGNFTYDKSLSTYKENYCIYSLMDSIKLSEDIKDA